MSLKAYALDVDANILFTDSKILLEKKSRTWLREIVEVSQSEFDEFIKDKDNYRFVNWKTEESMINFRGKWKFKNDIFDAIDSWKFAPSWEAFIEANRNASPIGIITARWHPIKDLRDTHKAILHEVLSDYDLDELISNMRNHLWQNATHRKDTVINKFLDSSYYCPCSDEKFLEVIWKKIDTPMPERKNASFDAYINHIINVFNNYYWKDFLQNRNIRVWFSDDSKSNIQSMESFIKKELVSKYPNIEYFLYDTANPHKIQRKSFKKH